MSKYHKDIIRLFHTVHDQHALRSAHHELRQTYGYDIRELSSRQDYMVNILSRAAVKRANGAPLGKIQKPNPQIAEALQKSLVFDESSACQAIATTLHVWRSSTDSRTYVGVRLAAPLFHREYRAATSAIDSVLDQPAAWSAPRFDLCLAWLENKEIARELNGTPLSHEYEFNLGRLQITPKRFDPYINDL